MVFLELVLGFVANLLYDSSKENSKEISTCSIVYEKAIEELSTTNYKLNRMQIDTFFHQNNVETTIKKYLKTPDKPDCLNSSSEYP
ncbi:MAG: hypothetical protein PHQ15_11915 [Methanosarcina sp.]|jgi:acyl-ACP thioesterase|nr:hypothetical protein [Methanosarcina sp.]